MARSSRTPNSGTWNSTGTTRRTARPTGPGKPRTWTRSEEHTSELQSHRDLPSFPTRRSSDLWHARPEHRTRAPGTRRARRGGPRVRPGPGNRGPGLDRKSTRLNSSHTEISPLSLHDALPIYGTLVPNTELGHLELDGHDAEDRASDRARETEDLD